MSGFVPRLSPEVAALRTALSALRRRLHAEPELAFTEVRTAAAVAERLALPGIALETGVAGTGVVATIRGGRPGRTVLLRADMDALPIQEATGSSYASRVPGVMHACGHDGHTAIAVMAAQLLAARRERLAGAVKIMFQPAEEGLGGALPMLEAGVLEDPPVEAAFALHLWNEYPVGTVCVRPGPVMAAADRLRVVVRGSGAHAAQPHLAVDPVVAAAQMILALQGVVAREVDPRKSAVISVTRIHGGEAFNVIPPEVTMEGTVRCLDVALREELSARIRRILAGIATATRTAVEVQVEQRSPVLVNDAGLARLVAAAAAAVVGENQVREQLPGMGSEDMAYVLERVPGCYFFVGSANAERGLTAPHHSPQFDFDEEALAIGLEVLLRSAEAYLAAAA